MLSSGLPERKRIGDTRIENRANKLTYQTCRRRPLARDEARDGKGRGCNFLLQPREEYGPRELLVKHDTHVGVTGLERKSKRFEEERSKRWWFALEAEDYYC